MTHPEDSLAERAAAWVPPWQRDPAPAPAAEPEPAAEAVSADATLSEPFPAETPEPVPADTAEAASASDADAERADVPQGFGELVATDGQAIELDSAEAGWDCMAPEPAESEPAESESIGEAAPSATPEPYPSAHEASAQLRTADLSQSEASVQPEVVEAELDEVSVPFEVAEAELSGAFVQSEVVEPEPSEAPVQSEVAGSEPGEGSVQPDAELEPATTDESDLLEPVTPETPAAPETEEPAAESGGMAALLAESGPDEAGDPEPPHQPVAQAAEPVAKVQPVAKAGPAVEVPPEPAVMDPAELRSALEAILLVVDEPVGEVMLAQVLDQPTARVFDALVLLAESYTAQGRGFELRRAAGGWRLYTREAYASYVERFILDGQSVRLTQAALETLSVVAYKQPVTRSRMSAIRGVNCDGVVRTLVSRGLIEECGAEPDSGAFLYRTTGLFLEKLGLDSLDQLPPLAPFLPDNVEELSDAST